MKFVCGKTVKCQNYWSFASPKLSNCQLSFSITDGSKTAKLTISSSSPKKTGWGKALGKLKIFSFFCERADVCNLSSSYTWYLYNIWKRDKRVRWWTIQQWLWSNLFTGFSFCYSGTPQQALVVKSVGWSAILWAFNIIWCLNIKLLDLERWNILQTIPKLLPILSCMWSSTSWIEVGIPCDLTPPSPGDSPHLILWYKNIFGSPIYRWVFLVFLLSKSQ